MSFYIFYQLFNSEKKTHIRTAFTIFFYIAEHRKMDFKSIPPPHSSRSNRRPSLSPSPSQQQQSSRSRTLLGCNLAVSLTILLLIIVTALALVGFFILKSRNDDLAKRLGKLEKIHAADALQQQRIVEPLPRNVGSSKLPQPAQSPVSEFDYLLNAGREKVAAQTGASIDRMGNSAATNAVANTGHWHADDDMQSYFFPFTIESTGDGHDGGGVRVPTQGSIEHLVLDRIVTFSVCCAADAKTKTCPPSDQIGVLVRNTQDTDENYLRVLIRNNVYYNKSCIFYWILTPEK